MTTFNESLRWKKYPVLNDGFITLVDVMGSDEAIVQAARVSYGKDDRYIPLDPTLHNLADEAIVRERKELKDKDRALIRYMMSHGHTTPFEMVEFKFLVRVPMDCWRQWIRHRTACLSGNTQLVFNRPVDGKAYRLNVKEVFDRFQPSANSTRSDKQRNEYFKRDRVQQMQLRCYNEDTGDVTQTTVVDIWESGIKKVFELKIDSGRTIYCSEDHRIHTPNGWTTLKNLKIGMEVTTLSSRRGLNDAFPNSIDADSEEWQPIVNWEEYYEISSQGRVRRIIGGKGSRTYGRCKKTTVSNCRSVVSLNKPGLQIVALVHREMMFAFGLEPEHSDQTEVCHNDGNSLNNRLENLRWGTSKENSEDMVAHGTSTFLSGTTATISSITEIGEEMTYDLEVSGKYANFSANDIVAHNSVNEYSTRYTEAIDSQQTTLPGEWRLQSTSNKQGSSGFLEEWPHDPGDFGCFDDATCKPICTPGEYLSDAEKGLFKHARSVYEERLIMGVAKEQARKDLPLSTYTEAYWKCDLHNIFGFLRQRMDSHAQLEIRSYANAMAEIVKQVVPVAWEAFEDYVLKGCRMSRMELEYLKDWTDRSWSKPDSMTDREWFEFHNKLRR